VIGYLLARQLGAPIISFSENQQGLLKVANSTSRTGKAANGGASWSTEYIDVRQVFPPRFRLCILRIAAHSAH